jgi:hypothetical protein
MVAVLSNGTRLLAGYIPSNVLSYIGVIIYGALTVIGFIRSCSSSFVPDPLALSFTIHSAQPSFSVRSD